MVWKAFLHIVINYRIEMTVGDTLKFFLLYALEMTPYIFWHRENYLNPLFPSKGDIWEEMGLCLFIESLLGQRSVRAGDSSTGSRSAQLVTQMKPVGGCWAWRHCRDTLDGKVERSVLISHPAFGVCSQPLDAEGFAKMLVGSSNEIRKGLVEAVLEKEEKQNAHIREWK